VLFTVRSTASDVIPDDFVKQNVIHGVNPTINSLNESDSI
jgi:hypothetical protein